MFQYWPSFKAQCFHFWKIQFLTHGYCFTNDLTNPELYFEKGLDLYESYKLDTLFYELLDYWKPNGEIIFGVKRFRIKRTELIEDIKRLRAGLRFNISCKLKGNYPYLQEIKFSFEKNFDPFDSGFRYNCDAYEYIYVLFVG
jgi:hypothetical protein